MSIGPGRSPVNVWGARGANDDREYDPLDEGEQVNEDGPGGGENEDDEPDHDNEPSLIPPEGQLDQMNWAHGIFALVVEGGDMSSSKP